MEIRQINGPNGRTYETPAGVFPSVTTILSKTKPESDKQKLEEWRQRVGAEEADRISKQSTDDGSLLHTAIERTLLGNPETPLDLSFYDHPDADFDRVTFLYNQWRAHVLPQIGKVHSIEQFAWNEKHKYAGAIDCVADFMGVPAVIDWKNSKKRKREEWIEDYRLQGAAYLGMVYRCPLFESIPKPQLFVSVIMSDEGEPQMFSYHLEWMLKHVWPDWEKRCRKFHERLSLDK